MWWWRWWMGLDPNRDRQPSTTSGRSDDQRTGSAGQPTPSHDRNGELERLRGQVTTLERTQRDAAQLREQVAELERSRDEAAALRAQVAELTAASAEADRLRAALDQARAEAAELRSRVAELEGDGDGTDVAAPEATSEPPGSPEPDMAEAKAVLGSSIAPDDLTVIDGVGPKIAGLLANADIDTWRALADTDVERLRAVLADAGPRYRMHDPSHWPHQAALLADGRWQEFKESRQG